MRFRGSLALVRLLLAGLLLDGVPADRPPPRVRLPCVACPTEENPDDPVFGKLAEEALRQYVRERDLRSLHRVLGVDVATTQLVAGTLTTLQFRAAPTRCPRDAARAAACRVDERAPRLLCTALVWERPWVAWAQTNVSCAPRRPSRSAPAGAEEALDPRAAEPRRLAAEALAQWVRGAARERHAVLRVLRATRQVASGAVTRLDFAAAPVARPGAPLLCHAEAYEKPWMRVREFKVTCRPGGATEPRRLDDDRNTPRLQ